MVANTTTIRYARAMDRLADGEPIRVDPLDLGPVLGVWRNANQRTWGISRVELSERDGQVWAHAWAVDPVADEVLDWGEAPVDGMYADGMRSTTVCGYRVTFDLGHARTQVQVNMLHSVAVCAAFTEFTDGSGRLNYFSREFLHRRAGRDVRTPDRRAGGPYARGDDRLPMLSGRIDPERLLATWRNTYADSQGIGEVTCSFRDGQLYVHVVAVGPDGPIDWGETPATLFTDLSVTGGGRDAATPSTDGGPTPHYADLSCTDGGPAYFATYEHGFMTVRLQGRFNIGILPNAIFTDFHDDSGRANFFMREVFIR
jgi:hypothetical protein